MPYDLNQHRNRVALRSDLTVLLTHLTRARATPWTAFLDQPGSVKPGALEASALDVLMEILETRRINGSGREGYIIGDRKAVCFQDTPMYALGQMFYQEKLTKDKGGNAADDGTYRTDYRYTLHGVSFDKKWVWDRGGRPVFYEDSEKAKLMLKPEEWWRIVDMNYKNLDAITDWTHEREWRVAKDFIEFELKDCYVVLPGSRAFKAFLNHPKQKEHNFLEQVRAIVPLAPVLF